VLHTRQPLTWQSFPASGLQVLPCVFWGWHVPAASQYVPDAQSVSLEHVAGHVAPPSHKYGLQLG
jgi:hypothetical protein